MAAPHVGSFERLAAVRPQLIQTVSEEQTDATVSLLCTAAFHLAAASLGCQLHRASDPSDPVGVMSALGADHTTTEVAGTLLATNSSVSVVDLCCAAVARVDGQRTGPIRQGEWDFGWWSPRKGQTPLPKDSVLADWVQAVIDDAEWKNLLNFRHQTTHRIWRRDIAIVRLDTEAVSPGERPALSRVVSVHTDSGEGALHDLLPRFVAVAERHFDSCVRALSAFGS